MQWPGRWDVSSCGTTEDANHIFFSHTTTQFRWTCFRETVGGRWCNTNFPGLLAEIHASAPATATLGGCALGSLPGRFGPFVTSLSFKKCLFDVRLTRSPNCVVTCSFGGRLAAPRTGMPSTPSSLTFTRWPSVWHLRHRPYIGDRLGLQPS